MKGMIVTVLLAVLLTTGAKAVELPRDLLDAAPKGAERLLEDADLSGAEGFLQGFRRILDRAREEGAEILRQRLKDVAALLVVVLLCGAIESFYQGTGSKITLFLPMAAALSVTLLTAGSLDALIGLGAQTIRELSLFSKALLPTLAAAAATAGAVTTATFQQVSAMFLVDLLLTLIEGFLMPMVYLYIGVLTASCCMPENRLGTIAEGLKKALTWVLTTSLLAFTIYLSVVKVISGAADGTSVKLTKAAISGVVPVVGGIIADAAETVLAGAGLLKNTIGIFGVLAVIAVCVYPFLQLGIQYLLYKVTAFLASAVGAPGICKLIDGLGSAFGLVLGMTGACAVLLLVSVLSLIAAVLPW